MKDKVRRFKEDAILKTSESLWFADVFRWYRKRLAALNKLNHFLIASQLTFTCSHSQQ